MMKAAAEQLWAHGWGGALQSADSKSFFSCFLFSVFTVRTLRVCSADSCYGTPNQSLRQMLSKRVPNNVGTSADLGLCKPSATPGTGPNNRYPTLDPTPVAAMTKSGMQIKSS